MRLHIKPALGRIKLRDITVADIAKFQAARRITPTNANRCRALLSHIFEIAERWGERPIGSNPCRHVEKFAERKRERFLSAAEILMLGDALAGAEGREPPAALAAIRLLILTGCRLSEILALEWRWVDFDRACLRLPDSKTGAKVVPLGAPALHLLAAIPRQDDNPYVLPAERGDGHFVGIQTFASMTCATASPRPRFLTVTACIWLARCSGIDRPAPLNVTRILRTILYERSPTAPPVRLLPCSKVRTRVPWCL